VASPAAGEAAADYYQPDLAWVHHVGYGHHVELTRAGILQLLQRRGLGRGARVLDVGCGSGLLARVLADHGYEVRGSDASAAMIALARSHAPAARFEVVALPCRRPADAAGGLPSADAVVSTGHVLNYLDSRADIAAALTELAQAVRPGGLLAIDLMTERYPQARDLQPHCRVHDDWAIVTRFSRPAPTRFDREITVFRRVSEVWRRSDEHHRNVTFDADEARRILADAGLEARVQPAFADEAMPEGLVVLVGERR
jgi:SAM-dependent methyltransferase